MRAIKALLLAAAIAWAATCRGGSRHCLDQSKGRCSYCAGECGPVRGQ